MILRSRRGREGETWVVAVFGLCYEPVTQQNSRSGSTEVRPFSPRHQNIVGQGAPKKCSILGCLRGVRPRQACAEKGTATDRQNAGEPDMDLKKRTAKLLNKKTTSALQNAGSPKFGAFPTQEGKSPEAETRREKQLEDCL